MRLFCFGTLLDAEVRALVIGRAVPDSAIAPAALPGFRRVAVPGETYPALVVDPAGMVEGLIVGPLTARELERVQFFEGFEYALEEIEVLSAGTACRALACLATEELIPGAAPWDLTAWAAAHKPRFLDDSAVYMEQFGQMDVYAADAVWVARRDDR